MDSVISIVHSEKWMIKLLSHIEDLGKLEFACDFSISPYMWWSNDWYIRKHSSLCEFFSECLFSLNFQSSYLHQFFLLIWLNSLIRCCWLQIYFHDIPDDIIDSLVKDVSTAIVSQIIYIIWWLVVIAHFLISQIEEGKVLNVAGGLIIEHPLIVPYVKQVVSLTTSLSP